jgi:hypothetical protein
MQVEEDDCAKFVACGLRSRTASFLEIGDQAIEGVVLAEEEDFVFASEIVVEVGGGEVSGGGDFAHAGFGEPAGAEFAAGGAENFEAAGEVAALEAGGAHGDRMAWGVVRVNTK